VNLDPLDIDDIRAQFPGLARQVGGQPAVFLDGPAGSQVPQSVAEAVARYLTHTNANTHGAFVTSAETDEMITDAQAAAADFVGVDDPATVVFGPNMTSLTFQLSRSLARQWEPGDEIVVTRLDHDANIWPWVLAARDAGATVRYVPFRLDDCTLDLEALGDVLGPRTRLVAVGAASNAVGTVNPIARIAQMAHAVGAEVYVDAVHYAPHRLPDATGWDCDYLVCSAYKFFGPHVGILWGRRHRLESLPAYRVRPAGDELPGRWMTGTPNLEGLAGTQAAIAYLEGLGAGTTRRQRLVSAFDRIRAHEENLCLQLLEGLRSVRTLGITDPERLDERVPTVAIVPERTTPAELAAALGQRGIFVWDGNFYALEVSQALGLEPHGMVRIGVLHYNSADEVQRLVDAVSEAVGSR
jgi:cysteine desulfurase family protein (TIGR01976 family)